MSENTNQATYIDIQQIAGQFTEFFYSTLKNGISFVKKYFFVLLSLCILGVVLGYLKDTYSKSYKSSLIVIPNFQTVDLLYENITLLKDKIKQKDSVFLKSNQLPFRGITKLSVKPIVDIYHLSKKDPNYFNVFKTLTTNNSAKNVIKDYTTSKNFPKHAITIKSISKISQNDIGQLVSYLNKNEFYQRVRVAILANMRQEIQTNTEVIRQIDVVLNRTPAEVSNGSAVYFNKSSELTTLIEKKLSLVKQNHDLKVHLDDLANVVHPVGSFLNIRNQEGFHGKYKIILPLFFVLCFVTIMWLRRFF